MPASRYDVLKTVYDLAMQVRDIDPWDYMDEVDMWAIQFPPPGKTLYTLVIGSMGEDFGIIFYRGERGLSSWKKMADQTLEASEALQHLDCLALHFDPWKSLTPPDRKNLKRFGHAGGGGLWPYFISHRPGRHPETPNDSELEILGQALRTSLPVLDAVAEDEGFLFREDESVLHLSSGQSPTQGQWLLLPEILEEKPQAAPPDELRLRRLAGAGLQLSSPWEILIGNSGARIHDGKGTAIPLMAIFADARSGFVTGFALAALEEMPVELPENLLATLERQKIRPEAFLVEDERTAVIIRGAADGLSIPVRLKERLPMAREALGAMRGMLKKGPGSRSGGFQ